MKKFMKGKEDSDDASRSRLFGGKSKSKGPAPAASNPYAAQPAGNPYAAQPAGNPYAASPSNDPYDGRSSYAPSTSSYASTTKPPPSYNGGSGPAMADAQARDQKSPVPPGGYGGSGAAPRYGNNAYGASDGYGSTSYGDQQTSLAPPQRSGGYGGLGRTKSQETMGTEAGRDALFGGARERAAQKPTQESLPPQNDQYGSAEYGGGGVDGGYSANRYQDRQLTAEEEEEEDVAATKEQIRFIKQQDVSSTRNALRIAAQAEETGRSTLERLGQQGERIHNTENNLDLASNQNRIAEEKARELKHLNRSMWAMKVDNPFTKNRRAAHQEQELMDQHHADRETRQATRREAYMSNQRQGEHSRALRGDKPGDAAKKSLAERNKYQFEADSEDEAMEDEIDQNLDLLGGAAGRLNALGRAMGREVDEQNKHIDRIVAKADKVDDQIVMNRNRLDRIR